MCMRMNKFDSEHHKCKTKTQQSTFCQETLGSSDSIKHLVLEIFLDVNTTATKSFYAPEHARLKNKENSHVSYHEDEQWLLNTFIVPVTKLLPRTKGNTYCFLVCRFWMITISSNDRAFFFHVCYSSAYQNWCIGFFFYGFKFYIIYKFSLWSNFSNLLSHHSLNIFP